MSERTVAFVRSLVERFPQALRPIFEEHIKDNFGEILPYLFIADICRHVESLFLFVSSGADVTFRKELENILSSLEEAYASGDNELQELISVSFLEHLPRPGEKGSEIRDMLGPRLSMQLKVIG